MQGDEPDQVPDVSVVIPCNDPTYLGTALSSLASQIGAPSFEVVIVDDADVGMLEDHALVCSRVSLERFHGAGRSPGHQQTGPIVDQMWRLLRLSGSGEPGAPPRWSDQGPQFVVEPPEPCLTSQWADPRAGSSDDACTQRRVVVEALD